jgi:hypothetical protein
MRASEETIAYWKQHVEAFQSSGLSRNEYCEQHQIKVHRLDYWHRRLIRPDGSEQTSGWIPLRIKDAPGTICLKVGKLEIEVRRGFDRQLLAEVLRVVAAAC